MAESPTNRPDPPSHQPDSPSRVPPPVPDPSTMPEAASETLAGDPAAVPCRQPPPPAPPVTQVQTGLHSAPTVAPTEAAGPHCHLPKLSGFEVLKELGRGGMGVVYLVRHCQMNRTEALKMILSGEHASAADLTRFHTEARTVASLHHSNFVQIYDVGEFDGRPFLRLEYVSGGNLEDWLDGKLGTSCLAPAFAAHLVERLALAMHHMHEKGLIHRDLKPANVLVDLPDGVEEGAAKLEDCELKISDFGLAREVRGPGANTKGMLGTPAYMAPEQATGGCVDRRADVYSLGAILYRLLTGRPPHDGDLMSVLACLIDPAKEPIPPSQLRPEVSAALDAVCRKSLQKDPDRRQATAKELADDLRRCVARNSAPGSAVAAAPTQPEPTPAPAAVTPPAVPARRRRAVAVWAGVAVAVVALSPLAYFGYGRWAGARATKQAEVRETKAHQAAETEARAALQEATDARNKGEKKVALRLYLKAEDAFEALHKNYPDRPEYVVALARAHVDEGSVWLEFRNAKEAEEDFTEAVELLTKQIPREAANDDVGLALADAYHHRGELQGSLMHWRAALDLYQDALKIREGLFWKNRTDRAFRRDLARSHSSIGDLQLQLGQLHRAKVSYDEADKLRRQLVEEDATDDEARYQLARGCAGKGKYFLWRGDLAGADRLFDEARRTYEGLASGHADVVYKSELADASLWLAEVRLNQNKAADVADLVAKARAAFDATAGHGADETASRGGRVRCGVVLARLHALTDPAGAAEDAAKMIDQIAEFRKYINVEQRQFTAEDQYNAAAARALRGDRDRASSTLKSAVTSYGYRNFTRLRLDVAFRQLLAKDAEFKKAVDGLEKEAKQADEGESGEAEEAAQSVEKQ
jgi:tetratricopeptide (TPR) repeat protein/predicted Ser/Thr protein kinase